MGQDKTVSRRGIILAAQARGARSEPTASLKTLVTDRPDHDRRYEIDDSKARTELDHTPACGFTDRFAATLAWYLVNKSWWRAVMDGSYREWVWVNYAAGVSGSARI